MLKKEGFDAWASEYDESVRETDASSGYPFAGYGELMEWLRQEAEGTRSGGYLDVGIGTGKLAGMLYDQGIPVCGIDFSEEMLKEAGRRMPDARLICHDFSKGLPEELAGKRFGAIVCTYAIHHLDDGQKVRLIRELLGCLEPGGGLYIGDVAFATRQELEACREAAGEDWDEEESYPVVETLAPYFPEPDYPGMRFRRFSFCTGAIYWKKEAQDAAVV